MFTLSILRRKLVPSRFTCLPLLWGIGASLLTAGLFSGCGTGNSSPGEFREVSPSTPPDSTSTKPSETSPTPPLEAPPPPKAPQTPPQTSTTATETPDTPTSTEPSPELNPVAAVTRNSPAKPNPLAGGDDGPVRLLIPEKTFKKQGDVIRLSYDDFDLIKVLNLKVPEPNVMELLPDWLKQLDGQKVQIRGFMYPSFLQDDLDRFVFCRDTGACCFGPNPVIYYLINVRMKKGTTTHYIENRPFDVTGTFRIKPGIIKETGLVYELYHLEDAVVRER